MTKCWIIERLESPPAWWNGERFVDEAKGAQKYQTRQDAERAMAETFLAGGVIVREASFEKMARLTEPAAGERESLADPEE